ncbi:hypothetical protein D3C85_1640710 [compost metagenome]
MNTPGKPLRWIALACPWALWAAAFRRQYATLFAWWHALLPDEAIALLQFPPHRGQRPDFFGGQMAQQRSCTMTDSLEDRSNE